MPSMPLDYTSVGQLGEAIAAQYFVDKGYQILERNYRKSWGEIDIVLMRKGRVHFVEVKTVSHNDRADFARYRSDGSHTPEQRVDKLKKRRLERVIESWLVATKVAVPYQLDVAAVHVVEREKFAAVNLIPNVDITS